MNEKELQQKFQMFEQQIMQIQQQLQAVEGAIVELTGLKVGLDELKGKTGKEIMAPVGRGIFTKANLVSEKLLVDVGGKKFVEKSIDETKDLIQDQLGKLKEAKTELEGELKKIDKELTGSMIASQEECGCSTEKTCEDKCGNDCKCEDEKKK